jgi:hypothetical protein
MKKTLINFSYILLIAIIIYLGFYTFQTFSTNQKIYDTITTGVISGIITSLILFIFQIIWRQNILMWIENMLYQDVCIEGEWSGFLTPYIGLDSLDKYQKEVAWDMFKEKIKSEKKENSSENFDFQDLEISEIEEPNDIEEIEEVVNTKSNDDKTTNSQVTAEVVIHKKANLLKNPHAKNTKVTKRVTFSPNPILIRAEIKRQGHNINGRIIEIGGASKTHTYNICGSFKNLILTGTYETFSKDHMDRGAFSLMLLNNGKKLEGFFSSYSDGEHRVVPMQCIINKNQISSS